MANIVVAIYNPLRRINGMFPFIETFLNGLRDAGNNVLCFEKLSIEHEILSNIPNVYKNKIEEFKPDLFIFFNNQFWDVSKYFDVPFVIYDVDSPNAYANIDLLKNNDKYKYFCITKSGKELIKSVIGCSESDICYIPPFTAVVSEKTFPEREIGFCGSHWLWNSFDEFFSFLNLKPSKEDRLNAKKIYEKYKENPCLYPSEIYKKSGIDAVNKITTNNLYVFSTRISGIKRLRYLLAIADLGLEIRGEYWDNSDLHMLKAFPELLLSYSSEIINNVASTQNFYNSSKIGFNTSHIQAKTGFGWRVADILASNACLVTEYSEDLLELGFNIPMYKTQEEARELCIKLLNDESYRQGIVDKCHEIIEKNHRFSSILPIMEDFVGMKLHSNEVGSLEIVNTDKKFKYHKIGCKKLKINNKIRYKLWKILDDKMQKNGLHIGIKPTKYNKILYKIWKHLNKNLLKKGIISENDFFEKIEKRNLCLQKELKEKYKKNGKVKVAFLHMYATSMQCYGIFDKMLASEVFDPYWVVNPDISRSKDNFDYQYKRTKDTLIGKYGEKRVLDGYDFSTNSYVDYTDNFDLATTTNPYEGMANQLFNIRYWTTKIPMFYMSYFYMGRCFVTISNLKNPQFNCFSWVFAENNYVKQLAKEHQIIQGRNIVVTGYSKMDGIKDVKVKKNKKKRVIIAPHHLIDEGEMNCGSFLEFCDAILEMPIKYPSIDFVYRPHPLLEEKLNKVWGKERTKKWINKMLSYDNVTYSTEGEYLELFVNSDALIHDCGSFMAEYLFTNHPCAYLKRTTANYEKIHTEFGHKCENVHYQIFSKNDLFNFIDKVIVDGEDKKRKDREYFAKSEVMINFPNVTEKIIEYLTNEITGN